MRVVARLWVDGRRGPPDVDLDVPVPPPTGPGGGRWVWTGPLPRADVDLGNGFALRLLVVRAASVAERPRNRATSPGPPPAGAGGHRCAVCGLVFPSGGALGGHKKRHRTWRAAPSPARSEAGTGAGVPAARPGGGRPTPPAEVGPRVGAPRGPHHAARDAVVGPPGAEDAARALTYHFQGRLDTYIAGQMPSVGLGAIRSWIAAAYGVLDFQPPVSGGPDPRAAMLFTDLSDADRLRLAARVLRVAGG